MRTVIIDDDTKIIAIISKLIHTGFPDISVVGTAGDIESGFEVIERTHPELLFLDINLPDGTGFDLLKRIDRIDFKLIFITAYEEYAVQAIKVSALDFILKPVDTAELTAAVNKAREVIKKEEQQLKINSLLANFGESNKLKRIVLHTSDYLHFVDICDIIRCESDNNYTFFYLTGNRKVLVSKTLKEYDELLKNAGFLRVHQSHLINTAYVDKFVKSEGGYLLMKDASAVPVSLANRHNILKTLDSMTYH